MPLLLHHITLTCMSCLALTRLDSLTSMIHTCLCKSSIALLLSVQRWWSAPQLWNHMQHSSFPFWWWYLWYSVEPPRLLLGFTSTLLGIAQWICYSQYYNLSIESDECNSLPHTLLHYCFTTACHSAHYCLMSSLLLHNCFTTACHLLTPGHVGGYFYDLLCSQTDPLHERWTPLLTTASHLHYHYYCFTTTFTTAWLLPHVP
jgi:hypothetical protein